MIDLTNAPLVLLAICFVACCVRYVRKVGEVKKAEEQRLQVYWSRPCTGRRWMRQFPNATKLQIRDFLAAFADAFCFERKQRLCFSPDDRVLDIYQTVYPVGSGLPDHMELETFVLSARQIYGKDIALSWRNSVTLGDLFNFTRSSAV